MNKGCSPVCTSVIQSLVLLLILLTWVKMFRRSDRKYFGPYCVWGIECCSFSSMQETKSISKLFVDLQILWEHVPRHKSNLAGIFDQLLKNQPPLRELFF